MAKLNDEELSFHYHGRFCGEDGIDGCRAHDPHWNWTTREMLERINETRRAVGHLERDHNGHKGV